MSSASKTCKRQARRALATVTQPRSLLAFAAKEVGGVMARMNKVWLALAAVGFVLLLPLFLPLVVVWNAFHIHRLRSAASRFACSGCGQVLGKEAIRLADREWAKHMHEMSVRFPGARFRVVRDVHAICPKCGKQYRFLEKSRTFAETPEPLGTPGVA
jgi:hypothetical protein